ncbi:trans-aconitate 2-methyltransferase [Helicobacter sp. MIT 14-3879]|uniref:class I SAM-dependent methyltransferase n=1 Tax=Helicobacter sp. MIT 14-3879 TaxID=2040649 RepID=UPI000E1EB5F7|nr:class I SAM-dependent methyltransferase [Helicobacter sp. MIT 14-3879]RDU64799.1 methyltransferase type 12 [Helicobacter sp. MIT 14-3879]
MSENFITSIIPTNWEKYYSNRKDRRLKISQITRKITTKMILNLISKYENINKICEFGGGDSCFYEAFRDSYPNSSYIIYDSSKNGVEAFRTKFENVAPYKQRGVCIDLLQTSLDSSFDLVFSAGLIEHFNKDKTKAMIQKHFEAAKSGGIVLITYPTPTRLYRFSRYCLERLNMWEFYDERALLFDEVDCVCKEFGERLSYKLNYYILLTQGIVVYRKY